MGRSLDLSILFSVRPASGRLLRESRGRLPLSTMDGDATRHRVTEGCGPWDESHGDGPSPLRGGSEWAPCISGVNPWKRAFFILRNSFLVHWLEYFPFRMAHKRLMPMARNRDNHSIRLQFLTEKIPKSKDSRVYCLTGFLIT